MTVGSAEQVAAGTAVVGAISIRGRVSVLPPTVTVSLTMLLVVSDRPSIRLVATVQVAAAGSALAKVRTAPSVSERVKSPETKEPLRVRCSLPGSGTQPLPAALAV